MYSQTGTNIPAHPSTLGGLANLAHPADPEEDANYKMKKRAGGHYLGRNKPRTRQVNIKEGKHVTSLIT